MPSSNREPERQSPPAPKDALYAQPSVDADHGAVAQNNSAGGSVYAPIIKIDLSDRRLPADQIVSGSIPHIPPALQPREDLLRSLRLAGLGVPSVRSVTGMPGAGKTQIAAAYARECIDAEWRLVAWINAENAATVMSDLSLVASQLGIGQPGMPMEAIGKLVRGRLEADGERCLLVFDNVTDPKAIRTYIPAAGKAHVVLTSSRTIALGMAVTVEVFTESESLAFLEARTRCGDPSTAARLAEELGWLPLALAHAAAVIAVQHLTYDTYLNRLREFSLAEFLPLPDDDPYPRGLAESVLLSLNAVMEADHSGLCKDLLNLISLLSPAGVTRDLLYSAVDATAGPAEVDAALGRLSSFSLLAFSADGTKVMAHRLVMRVIREHHIHGGLLLALATLACEALDVVRRSLGEGSWHLQDTRDFVSHVTAMCDHLIPVLRDDDPVAGVLLTLRDHALSDLDSLYRKILLDHYRVPLHSGLRESFDAQSHQFDMCAGDEVTVRVKLGGTGSHPVLADVSYEVLGCATTMASASIMADMIIGRTVGEAMDINEAFQKLIRSRGITRKDEDLLGDAIIFEFVSKHPDRIRCAMLAWVAWEAATTQALTQWSCGST